MKNHYRLIAVDLTRRKELDADPKATEQIEIVGQLKKLDADDIALDAGDDQSMCAVTVLEKLKKQNENFPKENFLKEVYQY